MESFFAYRNQKIILEHSEQIDRCLHTYRFKRQNLQVTAWGDEWFYNKSRTPLLYRRFYSETKKQACRTIEQKSKNNESRSVRL
jgi:hypothetical protein